MPCPLCGDICRCSTNTHSATPPVAREVAETEATSRHSEEGFAPDCDCSNESAPEDSVPPWRQEVAARLNRYQARRKPRPPRYPSLRLRFEQDESADAVGGVEPKIFRQRMAATSNQALALDGFAHDAVDALEAAPSPLILSETQVSEDTQAGGPSQPATPHPPPAAFPPATQVTAKIIEFPRSWTPPAPPLDELAEPVLDRSRPRILEAPEIVPPPPALGGITIEPARQPDIEKRPGIDIPLQSAPLTRRILAAAIDSVIIAAACALFGFIFCKMTPTAIRPPRFHLIAIAAGLFAMFWVAYQYLLVVYSGSTPGLLLARLELSRFDGSRAVRRLRRWRILASYLSAASLAMGYAWVFLDEDSLCWHDRITHTYFAPKPAAAKPRPS